MCRVAPYSGINILTPLCYYSVKERWKNRYGTQVV